MYGTLDELNSFIGVLIAHQNYPFLTQIQQDLLRLGLNCYRTAKQRTLLEKSGSANYDSTS